MTKLHHAVADGVSSAQLLTDSFQTTPDPVREAPPHEWPQGEPAPPRSALLRDALRDDLRLARGFPRLIARTLRSWSISLRHLLRGGPRMGRPFPNIACLWMALMAYVWHLPHPSGASD